MRIILSIVLAVTFTVGAYAQNPGGLSGYVRQEGMPVAGAEVRATIHDPVGNLTFKALTDENGFYKFDSLRAGSYMIIAEAERGKGMAYVASSIVTSGAITTLDLTLAMETYSIFSSQIRIREAVTISAGVSQPLDDVAKTVNVITGQEMRERADITLVDSLRSMPGFRVQQLGGFGRTATIKTRGLRNQDTAILLDGVRLRDAAAITGDASPFLSDITLTSVSHVEVLRGSGSSLYGTNSIGGTVNFITPTPQPGPSGQLSYAAGGLGFQRFRGNLSDATNSGKFGFNLAVARTAYTKGIDGNDNAHNTNFQGRLLFQPNSKTNISFRSFVSDAYVRLNSNPDTLGTLPPSNSTIIAARQGVNFVFDADDPDNTQRSEFFNGHLLFTHSFTDDLTLSANYSGLKSSRKNDNGILGVGFQSASTSLFDGLIQTANASLDWSPGTHLIRAGYEFELEKYGNDGFTPNGTGNFFSRAYQSSNTIYIQDLIGLYGGRLQLAGGFRAQFFSLDDPKFSLVNAPFADVTLSDPPAAYTFDGAASYTFRSTGTKIRAHVGNGYRVPSLYERFGTFFSSFFTPPFIALGDPLLKPEKSIAYDGGVEQEISQGKARFTAIYFYTQLIDTIGYGNVVPAIGSTVRPFGGYINQKGAIARGGEFSGTFKPSRSTDIFASYTLTKSLQRQPQVTGSGIVQTLGIPEHQFTLVATQRFDRFWINFDLLASSSYLAPIFSSSTFSTYVYRFGGNRRGDLTAGYTFKLNKENLNLRVFGTMENVFDHDYYENGFRTVGRNARFGVSFGF